MKSRGDCVSNKDNFETYNEGRQTYNPDFNIENILRINHQAEEGRQSLLWDFHLKFYYVHL